MLDFYSILWNRRKGGSPGLLPIDSSKPIKFMDYDGTILYSYTVEEFMALTAMPANPSHAGLIAQGWNWTLTDAKTYVQNYGMLNIGQMYITASGDTEIDIELHKGRLSPYLGICPNGTVEIDWGDGSAKDTITGTSLTTIENTQHNYVNEGSYTIKLHVVNGSFSITGTSSDGSYFLWENVNSSYSHVYQNAIQNIRLGTGITNIETYAFYYCYSLVTITIPDDVMSIGSYAFQSCYSLVSITLPDSITSIENLTFGNCNSLTSIMIPSGVTNIKSNALSGCNSLNGITIPAGVTSIGQDAFSNCTSLTNIILPDSVTNIGSEAFYSCYSLTSITMLGSITSLKSSTFRNCYSLVNITIPSSITSIENLVFSKCQGIKYFTFLPTTPPTVSNANAFSNLASDLVVYVPKGTLANYQVASNYTNITSKMVEME